MHGAKNASGATRMQKDEEEKDTHSSKWILWYLIFFPQKGQIVTTELSVSLTFVKTTQKNLSDL